MHIHLLYYHANMGQGNSTKRCLILCCLRTIKIKSMITNFRNMILLLVSLSMLVICWKDQGYSLINHNCALAFWSIQSKEPEFPFVQIAFATQGSTFGHALSLLLFVYVLNLQHCATALIVEYIPNGLFL